MISSSVMLMSITGTLAGHGNVVSGGRFMAAASFELIGFWEILKCFVSVFQPSQLDLGFENIRIGCGPCGVTSSGNPLKVF